jgi:hypothetical protein
MKIKISALLTLVLLISSSALMAQNGDLVSSVDGKEYRTRISGEQLEAAPSWNPEDANPPLTARKAVASASKVLSQLLGNPDEWKVSLICLRSPGSDDKWIYVVKFAGLPKVRWTESSGLQSITLAVLMNGETLKPEVRSFEDSPVPAGGFDTDCEFFDALAATRNRQQRVPGTSFVNSLVDDAPGQGGAPKPGARVVLRVDAMVVNHSELAVVSGKILSFHPGRGEVGKSLEAAISVMEIGGKRTVIMREEVAQGVRELWKSLPPEAQIRVHLEMIPMKPRPEAPVPPRQ